MLWSQTCLYSAAKQKKWILNEAAFLCLRIDCISINVMVINITTLNIDDLLLFDQLVQHFGEKSPHNYWMN